MPHLLYCPSITIFFVCVQTNKNTLGLELNSGKCSQIKDDRHRNNDKKTYAVAPPFLITGLTQPRRQLAKSQKIPTLIYIHTLTKAAELLAAPPLQVKLISSIYSISGHMPDLRKLYTIHNYTAFHLVKTCREEKEQHPEVV